MKQNILDYLNKCEGWKTAIKNSHWSSENLSEHKLFDEIADSLSDIEDVTAEIAQGLHGKINKNELKPTSYTIEGSKKLISDMLKDTEDFYSSIKEGEEYIGMRSEIEAFIGELNKYQYLMGLALKEDFKRNLYNKVNEDKKNMKTKLTEGQQKRQMRRKMRINEAMTQAASRRQVTRDEIFDILEGRVKGIMPGRFVSITYVCGKDVIKLKKTNWKQDKMSSALSANSDLSDKDWHKQLTDFNSDNTSLKKNPVSNIVAVQRYTLHWPSQSSYNDAYRKYKENLNNLRMSYGVGIPSDGMLGDNRNQREKIDGGGQFNQTGKLSRDFNLATSPSKVISTAYLINNEGDIIDEIPGNVMNAMTKFSDGLEKDIKSTLTPEQIEEYKAKKAELVKAFKGKTFIYDGILSIVATLSNGEKIYYINDAISPNKITVNPQAFKELAMEQLGASFDEIQGFEQNIRESLMRTKGKNTIRLTESQLHQVIKKSVNRILKEEYPLDDSDYDDSWVYEEIYKEINNLDPMFTEWIAESVPNEEIAAILANDTDICDKYTEYRYDGIIDEHESYDDVDRYDAWRDRQYGI